MEYTDENKPSQKSSITSKWWFWLGVIVVLYFIFSKFGGSMISGLGFMTKEDILNNSYEVAPPALDDLEVIDASFGDDEIVIDTTGVETTAIIDAAIEVYSKKVDLFVGLTLPFANSAATAFETCQVAASEYVSRQPLVAEPESFVVHCIKRNFWGVCKKHSAYATQYVVNPEAAAHAEDVFWTCVNRKTDAFNRLMLDYPVLNASFIKKADGTAVTDKELLDAFETSPEKRIIMEGVEDRELMLLSAGGDDPISRAVALTDHAPTEYKGKVLVLSGRFDGELEHREVRIEAPSDFAGTENRNHPFVVMTQAIQDQFTVPLTQQRGAEVLMAASLDDPKAQLNLATTVNLNLVNQSIEQGYNHAMINNDSFRFEAFQVRLESPDIPSSTGSIRFAEPHTGEPFSPLYNGNSYDFTELEPYTIGPVLKPRDLSYEIDESEGEPEK